MTHDKFPAWFGAIFLLVALALRASTFGDPNLHVDETFYQTVGIAMHEQHAVRSFKGVSSAPARLC